MFRPFLKFKKNLIMSLPYGQQVIELYTIFRFKAGDKKIETLYKDELTSRQTIIKRDGKSLGIEEDSIFVMLEGSEEAIKRARELAGEFEMKDGREEIYRKIKEAEEEASLGMGAIFG